MNHTFSKKLILLLLAGCSLATANAQIQFGLKAGLNLSSFSGSDATGLSSQIGFNGGALIKLPLSDMVSLQPEFVYSTQGAKGSENGVDFSYHANYFNIPVLLKFNLPSGFFFQTGPQIGFILSAKASAGGTSEDNESDYKSTDFSWVFGLGYLTSSNVGLDLRYNLGLDNVENTSIATNTGTIKNNVFQFGLFYMFGSSGGGKK